MSEQVTKELLEMLCGASTIEGLSEQGVERTRSMARELLLLRKREEWISVQDRLPDWIENWGINSAVVDAFGTIDGNNSASYLGPCHFNAISGVKFRMCYSTSEVIVTHWRPLPDAPTKD